MNDTVIVIMAKQPQVGRTKTRLQPELTPQEAAKLYEALMLDTLALVAEVENVDLAVAITPPESRSYFEKITPPESTLIAVEGQDIGECLSLVLEQLLGFGYQKTLALNADGPSLPVGYLHQAIADLDTHDIVIGPSEDGGYYLIGMKKSHPEIFVDIPWSSKWVTEKTMKRISILGLKASLTPVWYDVDTDSDLHHLKRELRQLPKSHLINVRSCLNKLDLRSLPDENR